MNWIVHLLGVPSSVFVRSDAEDVLMDDGTRTSDDLGISAVPICWEVNNMKACMSAHCTMHYSIRNLYMHLYLCNFVRYLSLENIHVWFLKEEEIIICIVHI